MFAKLSKGPIGLYNAASSAVSDIITGVVYIFVCMKALGGAFGIGAVTQYVSAVMRVAGSIRSFSGIIGQMRNNASFLKLDFEFLENSIVYSAYPKSRSFVVGFNLNF